MHNEKGGVPRHLPGRSLGWADWVRLVFALLPAAIVLQAQAPVENVVYSFLNFPNGASPYAPLTRDSTGNLYGTTNQGGESNLGVVFELDTSGKETVLHSFRGGADGANPYSGLLRSSSGTIYGTTYQGGTDNAGVVFEIGPSGHEKVLYTFTGGADGGNPYAGVIADSAGNLYGTTYYGGTANAGVVYKLAPSGQETVLYSFSGGADGSNPRAGLISDSDGNLYGTTVSGVRPILGRGGGVQGEPSRSGNGAIQLQRTRLRTIGPLLRRDSRFGREPVRDHLGTQWSGV